MTEEKRKEREQAFIEKAMEVQHGKGWYRIYDCGCLCYEWKSEN